MSIHAVAQAGKGGSEDMYPQQTHIMESIRQTGRCRPEVSQTAERLAGLDAAIYENAIRELVAGGEDRALGVLLCVCTVNQIKLPPLLLAETLKVVEPITDFAFPYRFQDNACLAPLLQAARAEDISPQRQAYAGLIAAELAVSFGDDPGPVRKLLLKLKSRSYGGYNETDFLIDSALNLLDNCEQAAKSPEKLITHGDVLAELPVEKPPVVIGGSFTVRRPIPKIGRNAPCHCGSGKKYKKCCYEKDRKLWQDASPYEGMTMTQVRTAPELVDDTRFIDEMRAYELKKLDPVRLNKDQLFSAYRRAEAFGLRELAFDMLDAYQRLLGPEKFDWGHFEDLLHSALDAGDVEIAEKIVAHMPEGEFNDPDEILLKRQFLKFRDHYALLESQCRKALCHGDEQLVEDPLIQLSFGLEKTYPALSIVFGRAFITGNPDRILDSHAVMDVLRSARAEIGVDPWSDPVEDYLEWCWDNAEADQERKEQDEEIEALQADLLQARRAAAERERELRQKERQLGDLLNRMEKEKAGQAAAAIAKQAPPDASVDTQAKETIVRLQQRIDGLKSEIRSQQQIRRQLREQLKAEKAKAPVRLTANPASIAAAESEPPMTANRELKKVLIPDFSEGFQRACGSLPVSVVAKAVKAAAGFAALDEIVLRHTKPIKSIPGLYRTRIGRDHRLMLRWIPDESLHVLDLIPRAAMEDWIKKHR